MHPAELTLTIIGTFVSSFLIAYAVIYGIEVLVEVIVEWREQRRQVQMARIEADLDAAQNDLRLAVLALAEHLAADRDEASRALTRAAYLSSGGVPPVE
ncbi:hypothetical protein AB3K78_09185 [Leucobacter sp. HNU]|uniref:hypothetical protein n=1 Tax=Leucobacter sp. HNU TaxID=3236805 RepID=UPI003A80AFAE